MCNDVYSGAGFVPESSVTTNVSNQTFMVRAYNLSDSMNPCMTTYYNNLLKVRSVTGKFNETYGWNYMHDVVYEYSSTSYGGAFYAFTQSYFYSHGTQTTCSGGYGCPSVGGGIMFGFINSSQATGTSLGYYFASPPNYHLCEDGTVSMNGSESYLTFCTQWNDTMMGTTGLDLNASPTITLIGGTLPAFAWHLTTNPLTTPLNLSYTGCVDGWRCNSGGEYHLSSSCAVTDSNACSECGCGTDGHCLPNSTAGTWICHSGSEAWHYNSSCVNDLQLACDFGCSGGICTGEHVCASNADCQNGCVGDTWYWGSTCNLTSYDCIGGSSQLCTNGCTLTGCSAVAHISPMFPDTGSLTAAGAVNVIYSAVLGFVNRVGGPFMILMFIFVGLIIVTIVFSAAKKLMEDSFS
jgi:hypothetical protein